MKTQGNRMSTQKMVLAAVLTALVILLQMLGASIKFGMFSITLVLIPIVIGAATCGYTIGAWLGLVFGIVVLISGDATAFLAIDVFGTFVTVLLKGTLCGLAAGLAYKLLEKHNRYIAVVAAAIVCPLVNTGIFLLGCNVFFLNEITAWGLEAGFENVAGYMFLGLIGANFLFELGANIILSPIIVRIINYKSK